MSPGQQGRSGSEQGRSSGIQVIRRAAAVLRAVGDGHRGARLTELSAHLGLPKTTVHRIVSALVEERLLRIDPAGCVWLGPSVGSLAQTAADDLVVRLRPVLVDLARATGETVDLSVLDGSAVRFVHQIPSTHRLRAVSAVGSMFPVHSCAPGKALLAALPVDEATRLLPVHLERLTPNTVTTSENLLAELDEVRRAGVAYDHEEQTLGVVAMGVAVIDAGSPVAALSIPTPAVRVLAQDAQLRSALIAAGHVASALLDPTR